MTEAANGPGASSTTAQPSTVIVDPGSNGDGKAWVAGLQSEENRTLVAAKQWGSVDDALKSYRELQTHASKGLHLPGEHATAEDWNAFYSKMGRPEKPDGYQLKLNAESVPTDFPYDEKSAIEFRNWAHEAGLSPRQAQMLHDKFVGYQAGAFSQSKEGAVKREGDTHRDLIKDWGDADTSSYKQNVELMSRAITQLGLKDALTELGALSADGAVRNSKVAKALARVGKELFSEDTMATTASGVISNPFSEGSSFNLTQQGQLIRSDPRKAAALIRAAGKNPADYRL